MPLEVFGGHVSNRLKVSSSIVGAVVPGIDYRLVYLADTSTIDLAATVNARCRPRRIGIRKEKRRHFFECLDQWHAWNPAVLIV